MTHVFGPDTTLDEVGIFERAASRFFTAWFPPVERALADQQWRFDREKIRLSVHGESEYSGDAYSRGQVVNTLWFLNSLLPVLLVTLLSFIRPPVGSVLFWAVGGSLVLLALFACANVLGSVDLSSEIQVIDHTTESTPEAVADLQEQYVDGNLDGDEFEARVEAVIDR